MRIELLRRLRHPSPPWTTAACVVGFLPFLSAAAAPGRTVGFTSLKPLPAPRVVAHSPAYPGGSHEPGNLVDADTRTEYSSDGKGTNTFVEFDFGRVVKLAAVRHVDRNDPATVSASELRVLDPPGGSPAAVSIKQANARGGITFFALAAPVEARRVRWQVTGLGPQRYGTVGGAEIAFYTVGTTGPLPAGVGLSAQAVPVRMKQGDRLVQPLRVTVDYPCVEPVTARLEVEGLEPRPLPLELGSRQVEFLLPAPAAPRKVAVRLEAAGKTLARVSALVDPVRPLDIYVLPHSHVDIGYTEIQTDVEKKQMSNLARALELARATASNREGERFRWNGEVLWAVDSYLRQATPAQQEEFIQAVKRGWIGLDAMYGNELTGLCRPEELLRLFRYATELSQRTGVPIQSAMISDVPGYTWGTVQAMAQAGVKYFSIAPNYFDRIGTTLEAWENKPFYWVGADGRSQVLCWVPYYGYALSHVIGELSESFLRDLAVRLRPQLYPYSIACLRWSGHGDNARPDEQLVGSVQAWNAKYATPRLILGTTTEAFRAFEQRHGAQLPRVRGDWTPYWEDGAGSSARETAQNRASAERLSQAEALWAMLNPRQFPADRFGQAWRNVLLYSEHTWGAHNSISQPDLPFVKEQWRIKQGFALAAQGESRELLEAIAPTGGAGPGFSVFNTASWPRTGLVAVPEALAKIGGRILDARGQPAPAQRLASGELVFLARDVPPLGASQYQVAPGEPDAQGQARARGTVLENSLLTVRIDPSTGNLVELRARGGRDLVDAASGGLNEYLYLPGSDPRRVARASAVRVSVREPGPLVASLLAVSDAPGCRQLTREIRLVDGQDSVEIANTVDKLPVRAKEGVHFGFAFRVPKGTLRMDVPFAVVRPEADQIAGSCKNWFTVQRWMDLAGGDGGVTWASADAPLVEVGELTATLIGSQKNARAWLAHAGPAQRFYSWVMNNHWHTNYRAEQEGPVVFRYAVRPHRGYDPLAAARFGIAFSQPLSVSTAARALPPRLTVEPPDAIVAAFKPSDDRQAFIVRLFGAGGKTVQARLHWSDPVPADVWLSDLSERPLQRVQGTVEVPAWGVVTLRATPAP